VQIEADGDGGVWINRAAATFDVLDDAVPVDDDVGAKSPLVALTLDIIVFEDAVGSEHLVVHVAEEGKLDTELFGEGLVGCGTIHAHTENHRIVRINLAGIQSRLDRLELLRSTIGEGEDVDGEEDVFLSAKVAQLHGFPLITE